MVEMGENCSQMSVNYVYIPQHLTQESYFKMAASYVITKLLLELYNVVLVRVMDSLFIVGVLNVIRRTSNVAHLPQRKQSVSQLN